MEQSKSIHINLSNQLLAPFQLALIIAVKLKSELVEQLCSIIKKPIVAKHAGLDYEYWIDYDSIGKVSAIKALNLFEMVAPVLTKYDLLEIKLEVGSEKLTGDNAFFLEYINSFCPNVTVEIIKTKDTNMQFKSTNKFVDYLYFGGESWQTPSQKYFESGIDVDVHSQLLSNYTWMLTHLDAIELAKSIFEQAYHLAQTPKVKTAYLTSLQITLVGLQQYQEVVDQPMPKEFESDDQRKSFFYAKAYAGVLSRNIDCAGKYFSKLDIDEHLEPKSIQHLYQLNIYALYLFHLKKADTALMIEKKILKHIDAFDDQNLIFIKYINALNLSRVYRARKDFDLVRNYCDMAYSAIDGLKTESDHIYYNLNYASIYEAQGHYQQAFYYWLRSCLHWQSSYCPQSLAWRPLATILGRKFSFEWQFDANQLNEIFLNKLIELAEKAGIQLPKAKEYPITISRIEHEQFDNSHYQLLACDQLSVLTSSKSLKSFVFESQQGTLNKQLVSILEVYLGVKFDKEHTIVINSNRGFGMAINLDQVRQQAMMLGIKHFSYQGQHYHLENDALLLSQPSLSPAVYKIEINDAKAVIRFKRYHQDLMIEDNEMCNFLHHLQKQKSLANSKTTIELSAEKLKRLYQDKVLS